MPNLIIPPRDLPDATEVFATDSFVVDNGSTVSKCTPEQIVDAGRPLATIQEAEAGTRGDRGMTPLTVAAAIAVRGAEAAGSFPTTVNPSVSRPFVQRARDSVSAMDLMSAGGLDNAVRNREATTTDATAITAAMQEALTACAVRGWRLEAPAGTYHLNARLTASRPVAFVGAGETATALSWANGVPSAGISIDAGGVNRYSQVSDMTMLCDNAGASAMHTPIRMDYSSLVDGSANIIPRAQKHGGIRNVTARSTTGGLGQGWGRGVEAVSMLGLDVSDCRFNGVIVGSAGNLPAANQGIWFYGAGRPTQLTVDRTYLSAFTDAVLTSDVEGIYLTSSEFVNVRRGYRCANAGDESGLVINGVHMNVLERAIDIGNMQDVVLSNNLLYTIEQSTVSDAFIVVRAGCLNVDIYGNVSRRFSDPKPMDGLKVLGGNFINVGHNSWYMTGQLVTEKSVRIAAGAGAVTVARQTYSHSSGAFPQIENLAGGAQFEEFRGYAGDLNAISTRPRMMEQCHILAAGATNFPPAWADPVSGIVRTLSVDDNLAIQNAQNPRFNNGTTYVRRRLGGVWSVWA